MKGSFVLRRRRTSHSVNANKRKCLLCLKTCLSAALPMSLCNNVVLKVGTFLHDHVSFLQKQLTSLLHGLKGSMVSKSHLLHRCHQYHGHVRLFRFTVYLVDDQAIDNAIALQLIYVCLVSCSGGATASVSCC